MQDQSRLDQRSPCYCLAKLACCFFALVASVLSTAGAAAVSETRLQQERATLKSYERRIPSLLTAMRSLDRQLATLQQQRDSVEQDLTALTRTYLTRQRDHEQALAAAAASSDKRDQAAADHSKFQYYLVERKLTKLQGRAEQLDEDMAPLKQSLQDRQRQLQRSEKKIAAQKENLRTLASATPTPPPERIEIKSRNKTAATQTNNSVIASARAPARSTTAVPPNAAEAPAAVQRNQDTAATGKQQSPATQQERRYASNQAKRLQALLADAESEKPARARARTLEVQHKDKSGVKHLYDLAYIGANHYTTKGTVHAGKQVFQVAEQRWITDIPAHDDGADYVFVLNATPYRRLELIMYNAALADQPSQPSKKTALSKK